MDSGEAAGRVFDKSKGSLRKSGHKFSGGRADFIVAGA